MRSSSPIENNNFTILVWSGDACEDTWTPFFTLFSEYWPQCRYRILLTTEAKDFSFPGLDIHCTKMGTRAGRPLPWGRRIASLVSLIETDVFLHIACDAFLKAPVDLQQIQEFVAFMTKENWSRQDCLYIDLTRTGCFSPFHLTEHPLLWEIDRTVRCRVPLQIGLWKRDALCQYIRPMRTAWNSEDLFRIALPRLRDRLLTLNRQVFNSTSRSIFSYSQGLIEGKWNKDVVKHLLEEHQIQLDSSLRGFHVPAAKVYPSSPIQQRFILRARAIISQANDWIDTIRNIEP